MTRLRRIEKRFNTLRGHHWELSSDQKWLLYKQGILGHGAMVALTVDGKQIQRWQLPEPLEQVEYFWLAGTYRFLVLWSGEGSPDRLVNVWLCEMGQAQPLWKRKLPRLVEDSTYLGCMPHSEAILARWWDAHRTGEIVLAHLSLPDARTVRHTRIRVGKEKIDYGVALSPDGRQIAFLRDNILWTVDTTGSRLRCRGKALEKEAGTLTLGGWQPGTDLLTFYRQGSLYRLNDRA